MNTRNHWWDWLKAAAFVLMVLDHLHFVFPSMQWTHVPGRLAFPLFAFVIVRTFAGKETGPYLLRLLAFAVVAELPYFLLTGYFGNVLFLFVFALYSTRKDSLLGWIGAAFCGFGLSGCLMIVVMSGYRSRSINTAVAALVNPFPLCLVSGAAGWVASLERDCIAAPRWVRYLVVLYPLHLWGLWVLRLLVSAMV